MSKRQITLTLPEFQLNTRLPAIWAFTRKWLLPNPGTLVIVILLTLAMPAVAGRQNAPAVSSTTTIPYQGRLANADGSPFTGAQVMTFRLFNAPSGGSPLWAESWTGGNSVQISDGLFSVLLGSLNNSLTSVVQSNPQLWLGIEVGTDAEMSPRVQLGSAAYAMQALTVPDGSITTSKVADGNVTVSKLADSSVTTQKIVDGSITSADLSDSSVTSQKIADGAVTQSKAPTLLRYSGDSGYKIASGSVNTSINGKTGDKAYVTFGTAFSQTPIVVISNCTYAAQSAWASVIWTTADNTSTGFIAWAELPSSVTGTYTGCWIAIGK